MKSVVQIVAEKGAEVFTVRPDDNVFDAVRIMADRQVGALPVVEGGKLIGILSERDCARKLLLSDGSARATTVREIMTERVVAVEASEPAESCMVIMTEQRIRHLPIMKEGALVGILSIGDLMKATLEEQQFTIRQLEGFIRS
jgi:CBS domain-containing protein